ncbi:autotransporter family protein [Stenotrophomonas muris]|uniref:autotransporter family protein n=1 Tax=Stenotrophomonas muris TaxID=2963283 RepID=UPI0040554D80
MHTPTPRHHALAAALAIALLASIPASAQQIVADGDDQMPAEGDYHTTEPVLPGDPSGHAFYAVNGGRILPTGPVNLSTEGRGAHAAHAEGTGSLISLQGASVSTTGISAAGASVATGARLEAADVVIETRGNSAHGVQVQGADAVLRNVQVRSTGGDALRLMGGTLQVQGAQLQVNRYGTYGLYANAGTATLDGVHIDMAGDAGNGVLATGTAEVVLQDASIGRVGHSGVAATAHRGARLVMKGVDIDMRGDAAVGLAMGGSVNVSDSRISVQGAHGRAVDQSGGALDVQSSELSGNTGLRLMDNGSVNLRDSSIRSELVALDINGRGNVVTVERSSLATSAGTAIWMPNDSTLVLSESSVVAQGDGGLGLDARGGSAQLFSTNLRTGGRSAHGLYAQGGAGRPPGIEAVDSQVLTEGDGSAAAIARTGGTVTLVDSRLQTLGRSSHGVIAGGAGQIALNNTHVRTEGEGAWAAVINDNGRMRIDGGSLVSVQHGGVWVRSSRDPGLTLSNGAVVSGGNGIALALDAAVAGRFDVLLEGRSQMVGDIVITPEDEDAGLPPQSDVHVRLADGSLWQGSSDLVQTMAIESGSQWTLTGDATVGELQVLNSGVALSDGSGRFNTLTVDGDLHSAGATFLFQGTLAGDDSAMDRVHVRGDSSGDALIAVKNIGGVGAPTVDGIALIEIDGASLASYTLSGRAVGGSYEYFLFQGGLADPSDGNWYLRSQWFDICQDNPAAPGCVVDPGPDPDPTDPTGPGDPTDPTDPTDPGDPILPPPVLRPEAGAYLANQSAAINLFAHRMHERNGARSMGSERQAWARVGRQQADFSAVGGQLSIDGNTSMLQIGTDLLQRGNAVAGVMLGSGRADSSVMSDLTGYSAKGRVRGSAVGVYGTWMQEADGTRGAYVDAALQYGRFDNRVQGIGLAPEHYDSRMATASLESGYTFNVWQDTASALYVQPQLQLSHVDFRADRHVESNGTVVDHADAGGLSGRLGVRVFGHGTAAGNTVQPYLGVNWLRGSGTSTLQFNGDTLAADVPRNRYEVQAGAELRLGQRWGAWGGMSVQRGDHGYRNVGGQLGLRMAW